MLISPALLTIAPFFIVHLMVLLALGVHWTFINCIWKYKVICSSIVIDWSYGIFQLVHYIKFQNVWTSVLELDRLSFSSLLWESNRYIPESLAQIKPRIYLLTISRAPAPISRTLFLIFAIDGKYAPTVISPSYFYKFHSHWAVFYQELLWQVSHLKIFKFANKFKWLVPFT